MPNLEVTADKSEKLLKTVTSEVLEEKNNF
jgi:hypothetical protein